MPQSYCISSLEGTSYKNLQDIGPPDLLFLVGFLSFCIIRYHVPQMFRTSFNIISKKGFRHKLFYFSGFTHPHSQPLNAQSLAMVTVKWGYSGQRGYFDHIQVLNCNCSKDKL